MNDIDTTWTYSLRPDKCPSSPLTRTLFLSRKWISPVHLKCRVLQTHALNGRGSWKTPTDQTAGSLGGTCSSALTTRVGFWSRVGHVDACTECELPEQAIIAVGIGIVRSVKEKPEDWNRQAGSGNYFLYPLFS